MHRSVANRMKTFASEFAKKYNLGDPVFGNFFQAQYDEYSDILHEKLMGGDDKIEIVIWSGFSAILLAMGSFN